jgi:hypothetical protein
MMRTTSFPSKEVAVSKESKEQRTKRKLDLRLDKELEDTFPASDAPKIIRSRPDAPVTPEQAGNSEPEANADK